MITENYIYWITRLDYIRAFVGVLVFVLAFLTLVFLVAGFHPDHSETERTIGRRGLFITIPLLVLFLACVTLVPTTKEMCAIKIIPAMANNEKIRGIGDRALTLTNEWLDELVKKKTNE